MSWQRSGIALALLAGLTAAHGQALDFSISSELRYFPNEGYHGESGPQPALEANLKYMTPLAEDRGAFNLHLKYRHDVEDPERRLLDFPALNVTWLEDRWEFVAGMETVFWGVAESQNIVNVINQVDLLDSPDGKSRLGQLMLRGALVTDFGGFEVFLLPGSRERRYSSEEGRLGLQFAVADPVYQSSREQWHLDYAVRWRHYVGDLSYALSYFDGTNRTPFFRVDTSSVGGESTAVRLVPVYDQMSQWGAELQYIWGGVLIKAEVIDQENSKGRFFASVSGVEYTLGQILDTAGDLTLYAEYLYDERGAGALAGVFENDLMLAARFAFNNDDMSSMLVGWFWDDTSHETVYKLESSTWVSDSITFDVEAWLFNTGPSHSRDPLERLAELSQVGKFSKHAFLNDEDYLEFQITYHF